MSERHFNSVFAGSLLYDTYERDEDGRSIVGEVFPIYIGNEYGQRFQHSDAHFNSLRKNTGPDPSDDFGGYWPPYVHDPKGAVRAILFAEKVQAHIDGGGQINFDHWHEVDPAYGSAAYAASGAEQRWAAWEREQEHY